MLFDMKNVDIASVCRFSINFLTENFVRNVENKKFAKIAWTNKFSATIIQATTKKGSCKRSIHN